ncbi:uncharacterized protein LOC130644348 [Hydractinia symbiolongicarpus]|uniref:uncharacterized protein LOC130644348 n=1 Tax=Hydractinia symbiolongicarpus TaxID=13093 RepID=UPI00254F36A0|nr:uncharacterized protein LOC130644348 [Hydractinia symbiolongicarpus]
MGSPPRKKLKDGAVPTLFNFTKQPEKRKRTEKRIEDRQKRQLIDSMLETEASDTTQPENKQEMGTQFQVAQIKVKIPKPKKKKDKCCNTDFSFSPDVEVSMSVIEEFSEYEEEAISNNEKSQDESFNLENLSDSENDNDSDVDIPDLNGTCFIVFWSCLLPLLRFCFTCFKPAEVNKIAVKGTQLIVHLLCSDHHAHQWSSQPLVSKRPWGNAFLSHFNFR